MYSLYNDFEFKVSYIFRKCNIVMINLSLLDSLIDLFIDKLPPIFILVTPYILVYLVVKSFFISYFSDINFDLIHYVYLFFFLYIIFYMMINNY